MAAVDYFLKLDGIDGESQDAKHKGEIDLESWSWGESQSGTHSSGGGGGAGKVSMQDFHFVMKMNKASPQTRAGVCDRGAHQESHAHLPQSRQGSTGIPHDQHVRPVGRRVIRRGGSGHGDIVPTDQISLNFSKIEYDYKPQKADGSLDASVKAGYDLKSMKKL